MAIFQLRDQIIDHHALPAVDLLTADRSLRSLCC